jgi:hypothetical protein
MNGEHIGTLIHRDANKWDHSHHHSDGSGKARDAAVAARTASRKLQVSSRVGTLVCFYAGHWVLIKPSKVHRCNCAQGLRSGAVVWVPFFASCVLHQNSSIQSAFQAATYELNNSLMSLVLPSESERCFVESMFCMYVCQVEAL